ncbi:MAG: hypothetical protein AWU54_321 [Candidatus Frackibacter sp. T328-2]|nr:MAG: hypothetical protein AWU54_321 [Candidatus Frackibacter sp. T328-2]
MAEITQEVVEEVIKEADDVDYGEVRLIIKDGKVIDIVTQNRKRLSS